MQFLIFFAAKCTDSSLRLYNGYATSMSVHTHEWCGKLDVYNHDELQYPTFSSRTVIRFLSGSRHNTQHRGFKLLWLAFYIPNPPGAWSSYVVHVFFCFTFIDSNTTTYYSIMWLHLKPTVWKLPLLVLSLGVPERLCSRYQRENYH